MEMNSVMVSQKLVEIMILFQQRSQMLTEMILILKDTKRVLILIVPETIHQITMCVSKSE